MAPIEFTQTPEGDFRLFTSMVLSADLTRVFNFFANALTLQQITPPWLDFKVLDQDPANMHSEKLIDYTLKLHGIPIRWQSKISVWEPPHRFVDEQIRGPYRRWHHEHRFVETSAGIVVEDIVHYRVLGGAIIERLFVRSDLRKIFAYRHCRLAEIFGTR